MSQARNRQMHLNAFLMANGQHEGAWRHDSVDPARGLSVQHYVDLAHIAERGKLDSLFLADTVALLANVKYNAYSPFEPITLLSALAVCTERIGLIATASTNYNEPYTLARMFASLDRLSGGRAGWNIVTSGAPQEARNFSLRVRPDHELRYERATEFIEVVTRLWDSWDDRALVLDKALGVFADTELIRSIDYEGKHFVIAGPLTCPRPIQGYPLLVQAGSSETGKEYAARYADAVFTVQQDLADCKAFYDDVKGRAKRYGRSPDQVKILPGVSAIIGRTKAEAREKERYLNSLITPEYGLRQLSQILDYDLSQCSLDAGLPDVGTSTEGNQSRFDLIVDVARSRNYTIRDLIDWFATSRGHRLLVGTPGQIADELELWFTEGAADGFNVMPPTLPAGLTEFVDLVVPELQDRGLFRRDYADMTLREHYGLRRPGNSMASSVNGIGGEAS
jgi:N-acetyl-S-(2-succino)cysteine monooxygenase